MAQSQDSHSCGRMFSPPTMLIGSGAGQDAGGRVARLVVQGWTGERGRAFG